MPISDRVKVFLGVTGGLALAYIPIYRKQNAKPDASADPRRMGIKAVLVLKCAGAKFDAQKFKDDARDRRL